MFTKSKLYRNALLTSSLNKGFSTLLSFPAAVLVFSAAAEAASPVLTGRTARPVYCPCGRVCRCGCSDSKEPLIRSTLP